MKKITHHKIDTSIYCQDVFVIFHDSCIEATKYINDEFDNEDKLDLENDARGFQWETSYKFEGMLKNRFFMFVNSNELLKHNNTTVEHELIHLTWAILDHVGVKIKANNHEAFTYFFEHLLVQVKNLINQPKS